jgi:hypothetical protein
MRHRLPLVLLAAVCATLAGQALAPGASRPRADAAASKVIRLPSASQCLKGSAVRITFSPPAGQTIASLSVRVGPSEALQVAGLTGAGSLVVKVPRPGVRVSVTGSTSSGSFISTRRSYERCVTRPRRPASDPAPTPTPAADPPTTGGGGGGG